MGTFATAAEAFCAWAEAPPGDQTSEALAARQLLADIYRFALDLPFAHPDSEETGPDSSAREAVYRRFGALPFNYYSLVDPLIVPAADSMTGDLADDLADIWSDLKVGITLHRASKVNEALHEWRWRFDAHWGQHAVAALFALQSWIEANAPKEATAER